MEKGDDPWEILGVPRDASESDIKKAFRKGAIKYHPDKQTTDEDRAAAHDIFAKFSAAYETLNDPVARYDWKLAEEARGAKKAAPSSSSGSAPKKSSAGAPPQKRPTGGGTRPQKQPAPPGQRPRSPKPPDGSTKPSRSPPPPTGTSASPKSRPSTSKPHVKRSSYSPPPPTRKPQGAASPKRHSAPVSSSSGPPKKNPAAPKRTSEMPPSSMGWQRQPGQNQKAPKPTVRMYRDPFDIFESVMKEEYGENYKDKEESGWMGSIGVPGLAKINPFKKKSEDSHKEFKKLDINNDKTLSKDELGKYIESHSDLWSTLGMNLNLPVKKCIEVATDVAFSLAFGEGKTKPKNNELRKRRELSEAEFKYFHKNFVLDEKGSHEFFLRTIFSVFDLNNDGVLNAKELDKFLDIFYKAKDVFKGNMKLPEKKHLLKIVGSRLDKNRDGVLEFHEIRDLLEVAAVVSTDK